MLEAASGQGGVGLVVLTHRHADHSAGASRFAALAGGPPVRAADPALQGGAAAGTPGLADGDELALAGGRPHFFLPLFLPSAFFDPDLPADRLLRTDFSLGELKSMRVLGPIVREFDKGVEAWLRYPSTRPDLKDHWAWLGLEARSEGNLTKAEFQFVLDLTKRPGLRVWTGLKKEVERLVKTYGYASEEPDIKAIEWRSNDETWIDDGQDEDGDTDEDLSDLSDIDD